MAVFSASVFSPTVFNTGGIPPAVLAPNGNGRKEYQPTYYEMRERREIERKFEEARLDLKATQIQIEQLEFNRLRDLADAALQLELIALLARQNDLMLLIEQMQQQKLKALADDDELLTLLMYVVN